MNASSLYTQAVSALTNGNWSQARTALDNLARTDNVKRVPDLDSYPSATSLRDCFRPVLADRIELANSVADRNNRRS